jgi:hypothetical protein
VQKANLDCLYYPFSRLLDATTLKHLLLVFDSITFLDEISSRHWRRELLDQMRQDSPLFATFDELADDYEMLEDSGAVRVTDPQELCLCRKPHPPRWELASAGVAMLWFRRHRVGFFPGVLPAAA